jgi:hypothetical protein
VVSRRTPTTVDEHVFDSRGHADAAALAAATETTLELVNAART